MHIPKTRITMNRTNAVWIVAALGFALLATQAIGYDRYKDANETPGSNCSACHGDFNGPTSPMGTSFPGDDKHSMHNGSQNMNAECNLCHTSGDGRNPFLGSSDGTPDSPGLGCAGCHGREADAGNDNISAGRGAGLRQHHSIAGVATCAACHLDANPANYTPVPENMTPPYYGVAADSNVDLACNGIATAKTNENWSVGDFLGSDNDGDGVYDSAETDCFNDPQTSGEATLLVESKDVAGGELTIVYDVACLSQDNTLVFGPLSTVSSHSYTGALCDINNSGAYVWPYDSGSVFFLVVANDGGSTEGSYGAGLVERPTNATCGFSQGLANSCN
jgi:hypothetical protein